MDVGIPEIVKEESSETYSIFPRKIDDNRCMLQHEDKREKNTVRTYRKDVK